MYKLFDKGISTLIKRTCISQIPNTNCPLWRLVGSKNKNIVTHFGQLMKSTKVDNICTIM